MRTVFKSTAIGKPNEICKQWAVYTLQDATTFEIVHVGHIRLSQLLSLADARQNPAVDMDRFYMIDVFEIADNAGLALRAALAKIRELGLAVQPKPRATPVECLTTGERFNSAGDACAAHGVSPSNLSNHLNNRPGFNTVKGKIYRKVVA